MIYPPRQHLLRRVLYRVAKFFFPAHPCEGTRPLTKPERLAAYELRRGKPYRNIEGKEHIAALYVYRAGQILSAHNARQNFDRHAAARARVPAYPLHKLPR